MLIVELLAVWLAVAVVAGLFVGAMIRFGEDESREWRPEEPS